MPMLIDRSQLLDADGNPINPVEDETVVLLRRIVRLLEPSGVQDSATRQRVR